MRLINVGFMEYVRREKDWDFWKIRDVFTNKIITVKIKYFLERKILDPKFLLIENDIIKGKITKKQAQERYPEYFI
jgi:hypothetical protein